MRSTTSRMVTAVAEPAATLGRRQLLKAGTGAALGAGLFAGGAAPATAQTAGGAVRFGFGQRVGQIVQFAYVVEDIHAAMQAWVADAGTGPWFLLESFTGPDQVYRGQPSTADVSIAMAFNGHMLVELIQPKDDEPSVYREVVDARGYGFHHVGIAVADTDEAARGYLARGFVEAFSADVPSGGRVRYMDNGNPEIGFIELIPATSGMDELFTAFWHAAAGWNGVDDPVRGF